MTFRDKWSNIHAHLMHYVGGHQSLLLVVIKESSHMEKKVLLNIICYMWYKFLCWFTKPQALFFPHSYMDCKLSGKPGMILVFSQNLSEFLKSAQLLNFSLSPRKFSHEDFLIFIHLDDENQTIKPLTFFHMQFCETLRCPRA